MSEYYILNGREIVKANLLTWATWYETANRHVGNDIIGDARVSTVFLSLNHGIYPTNQPVLFETMIFGGINDGYQDRCNTYDEAEKMHARICAAVREGVKLE